ncbi:MAG: hypothetical protein JRC68_04330 [Deltaproteobacteria bacterium]|nr:hypothetical protein [Deltaproteobacteria bacterium]
MPRISYFKLILYCFGLVICTTLTLTMKEKCHGYIMPAEQLVDYMAANFSKFKTLVITQATQQIDQRYEETEKVFKEQILMKSPDLFYSRVLDQNGDRATPPDITYRQLLVANKKQRLEQLLSMLGIDLQSVAFTRIDGIIAYRIGDKLPDSPKILIEKERFLPLLLVYRESGNPEGDTITVRFRGYRKLDKGFYPYEISYSVGDKIREIYTIQTLQANVPVNSSLLHPFEISSYPQDQASENVQSEIEEERLRRIIKTFQEKY